MQMARYGRMRFSRCMREDHGSVGCSAVVLPFLDQKCSGRRACILMIPDATLHNIHPCPKELMPYLEASYSCVTVKSGSIQACALFGGQPLPPDSGYLASATSSETGVGLVNCPWMIEAQAGHKVNLTLYGFSSAVGVASDAKGSAPGPPPGGPNCPWTVVVRESNLTVQLPGCTDASREKLIYTSHGGNVQVHLILQGPSESSAAAAVTPILLRYQVFGCADMGIVANALVRRYGETTIIRCSSGNTYIVTCTDNQWKGDIANCSKASTAIESGQMDLQKAGIPYGLLLVIGIGVLMGLLLGVFMLFAILFCLRRQRRKKSRSQTTDPLFQRVEFDDVTSSVYLERCGDSSPFHQNLCPYHHKLRYQWSNEAADLSCVSGDLDLQGTAFSTLSLPYDGLQEPRTLPRSLPGVDSGPPGARPLCNDHSTPTMSSLPSLRCHNDKPTSSPSSADCLDGVNDDSVAPAEPFPPVKRVASGPTPPTPPNVCKMDSPSPIILDLIRDSLTPGATDGTIPSRHLHSIAESPAELLHLASDT